MQVDNVDKVSSELKEYVSEVERRLRGMVAQFAYESSLAISRNIPIGDATSIEMGLESTNPSDPTVAYANYYKNRMKKYGIEMKPGFHRGALRYSSTGNFSLVTDINSMDDMSNAVFQDADTYYDLGDTFYIGASGPGYYALEKEGISLQAPNGFITPANDAIMEIYKSDIKYMYDSAE